MPDLAGHLLDSSSDEEGLWREPFVREGFPYAIESRPVRLPALIRAGRIDATPELAESDIAAWGGVNSRSRFVGSAGKQR